MVIRLLDSTENRLALLDIGGHRLLGQDLDTPPKSRNWQQRNQVSSVLLLDRAHSFTY